MSLFQILTRTAMEPQGALASVSLPEVIVIQDRFSWSAAFLTPVWVLYHRMWPEALIWLVAMIFIGLVERVLGDVVFWFYVLLVLWVGLEAANLRVRALQRKGYQLRGTIVASSPDLAELEWVKKSRAFAG